MLDVLYEDKDVLVVVKPAGIESQTSRRLEPDMVSEIKNYLQRKAQETKKLSTGVIPKSVHSPGGAVCWSYPPLDKPVRGMVYGTEPESGSALEAVRYRTEKLEKIYQARMWKTVDNVGKYVDYLLKDGKRTPAGLWISRSPVRNGQSWNIRY